MSFELPCYVMFQVFCGCSRLFSDVFCCVSDGLVFLMKNYDENMPINISTGKAVSIEDLAKLIAKVSGYHGSLEFDETKPDGMPYKVLDNTEISNLGWNPKYSLEEALKSTYDWYLENADL